MAERIIWNGDPGTVWTNNTDRVKYQFICSLVNTCGTCLQYHMAIGAWWGIPLHYGCRCRQQAVKPGGPAPNAFVDFQEILDTMPHDQQVAAVGASNYRLLKTGVVGWKDVVTPSRVRDLREVVSIKKLSVDRLVKAGVKPRIAEEAHASVNTPEHQLIEQKRKELTEKITAAGLSQEGLVKELASRLAARVRIAPGPPGPPPEGSPPGTVGPPAWGGGGLPGVGGSHAAELAKLLARPLLRAAATVPTPAAPKPPPAPEPAKPPAPEPAAAPTALPPEPAPEPTAFSNRRFGQTEAEVEYQGGTEATAKAIFGNDVTKRQIASAVGAPDDASVTIIRGGAPAKSLSRSEASRSRGWPGRSASPATKSLFTTTFSC